MNVPLIGHPTGNTRALNEVIIRARVKGFLQERNFSEGQNVKRGQLLLVIEEKPFQVKVDQAKAALEEAHAALNKARETKAREIASAQVALSKSLLDLAEVEERRELTLFQRKASSMEDVQRKQAMRKKDAAQVDADKASLEQATADYDINILAAQAKVAQAKADLDAAQIDLGYCRMVAPIDGRIGELQVKLGNLVGPAAGSTDTTSLVTIEQLDPMGVDIRPASRFLPIITKLVERKSPFSLRVQGQKAHPHDGRLIFMDNTIDTTTSTVLVKGEVPNPDHTLLPGEYVKVDLNIGDYTGGVVVPEEAVVETQEGFRVLIVDGEDKVQESSVKPLDTYQGLSVLASGPDEGQRVIVKGIQFVRPGQTVQATEVDLKEYNRPRTTAEESDLLQSPFIRIRGIEPGDSGTRPDGKINGPAKEERKAKPPVPAPEKVQPQPERESP
jgi:RND family efflux transporter MFP subunit